MVVSMKSSPTIGYTAVQEAVVLYTQVLKVLKGYFFLYFIFKIATADI